SGRGAAALDGAADPEPDPTGDPDRGGAGRPLSGGANSDEPRALLGRLAAGDGLLAGPGALGNSDAPVVDRGGRAGALASRGAGPRSCPTRRSSDRLAAERPPWTARRTRNRTPPATPTGVAPDGRSPGARTATSRGPCSGAWPPGTGSWPGRGPWGTAMPRST